MEVERDSLPTATRGQKIHTLTGQQRQVNGRPGAYLITEQETVFRPSTNMVDVAVPWLSCRHSALAAPLHVRMAGRAPSVQLAADLSGPVHRSKQ